MDGARMSDSPTFYRWTTATEWRYFDSVSYCMMKEWLRRINEGIIEALSEHNGMETYGGMDLSMT